MHIQTIHINVYQKKRRKKQYQNQKKIKKRDW